jgi:hypothetical protein
MKIGHNGSVTLPVLIFCLLLLQLVASSLPYFDNTENMAIGERNRLQAEYNAEAGVWLGLLEWSKQPDSYTTQTYSLPSGMVKVTITSIDTGVIQIKSFGSAFNIKDGIEAKYDVSTKKLTHWHLIIE